jgi:CelD/BcsL family acetyltransferase involved in cellulose biosynthesis
MTDMLEKKLLAEGTLREVNPLDSPEWRSLLKSPDASIFHSPEWMRVMKATYEGLLFHAVVIERLNHPIAGVAWTETDDMLGHRKTTLAGCDYCDVIASSPEERRSLGNYVLHDGLPWSLRSRARNKVHLDVQERIKGTYALQTIDLQPAETEMWTRLSSMSRRGVRKAQREGVKVRIATDHSELREWFLLHLRVRRNKHRLLAQPFAFFENMWDEFIARGNGFLLLAEYDSRIIGGDLFLTWRDQCYYKSNASDTSYLHLRPNNLLLWYGMLEAKTRGCTTLDLGRSPRENTGLVAFKEGFGAQEETLHVVDYDTYRDESQANREREARDLMRSMTQMFVREDVSEAAAEEAGARLYRYFV